ncbi:RNA-binding transcriptional accessory protein [Paracoccus sp. R12_1]|uniref:Tex family protein n=1 Tax=unclassified Paracoccus (in: a-proteobacteria) TaxID=2688777 RepID=UPI001ADB9852|nr:MULTISPECIES: Tex family protein [unclassified Paracoccus (in: a-proteobacteria)]MBO9456016.1 RNA-binding transcriptional accessory protein [Paracoccus sp. R12_2]MBO9486568.1 RNA-binding transcriptional accessory protein [Paracoccus sp. R12_1]
MDAAQRIARIIATEINANAAQVVAATQLLDGGATVPFVARYRKEVTGGLDDTQLRMLSDRLSYLREMEARRESILGSIREQGKLTDDLARAIAGADTKAALEDIYLPFKPKRRTKAMIARENGLEPLLRAIQEDRGADPKALASSYVTEAVPDQKSALDGARDILVEELSENATLLGRLRDFMRTEAFIAAKLVAGKEDTGAKFSDYFDHREAWAGIPAHRALAILRAAKEEVVTIDISPDPETGATRAEGIVAQAIGPLGDLPGDQWLRQVAGWTWRVRLSNTMYIDLLTELRKRAHDEAIRVFGRNLKDLLLAAPAGAKATIGLDPGIRTGVKVAVIDATGKLVDTATIYPFQPRNDLRGAEATLLALIAKHDAELIAIGNGTASRETERLVGDVLKHLPKGVKTPTRVVVSEAGASVYSASEQAAKEFPDLDVSLRGAVSIARRLQDPLAELVKVPPESIGVGQYQHDVDQRQLTKALEVVVEDAVNAVGVDLNTASAPLLAHVAGLGPSLASAIVAHRDAQGAFASRAALKKVSGLGPRAFEQCAGFLRIRDGSEPLDASSVHPEAYNVARKIVAACGRDIRSIMGDGSALNSVRAEQFVDEHFGLPTVRDILSELEKPGRDPRPDFVTASFTDGVEDIKDLKPGMSLEGTVTNVAAFGAFVDIGVHQDGLVHISQLADRFVKDPNEVVKVGDVVRVRVTEVDIPRKRIGLTMRKDGGAQSDRSPRAGTASGRPPAGQAPRGPKGGKPAPRGNDGGQGALGAALMNAMRKR